MKALALLFAFLATIQCVHHKTQFLKVVPEEQNSTSTYGQNQQEGIKNAQGAGPKGPGGKQNYDSNYTSGKDNKEDINHSVSLDHDEETLLAVSEVVQDAVSKLCGEDAQIDGYEYDLLLQTMYSVMEDGALTEEDKLLIQETLTKVCYDPIMLDSDDVSTVISEAIVELEDVVLSDDSDGEWGLEEYDHSAMLGYSEETYKEVSKIVEDTVDHFCGYDAELEDSDYDLMLMTMWAVMDDGITEDDEQLIEATLTYICGETVTLDSETDSAYLGDTIISLDSLVKSDDTYQYSEDDYDALNRENNVLHHDLVLPYSQETTGQVSTIVKDTVDQLCPGETNIEGREYDLLLATMMRVMSDGALTEYDEALIESVLTYICNDPVLLDSDEVAEFIASSIYENEQIVLE